MSYRDYNYPYRTHATGHHLPPMSGQRHYERGERMPSIRGTDLGLPGPWRERNREFLGATWGRRMASGAYRDHETGRWYW
jgi:hypothetical protein